MESLTLGSVSVLIAAAGTGRRLGSGPKALLKLGGVTLLERVLKGFEWADELLVAYPPGWEAAFPRGPKIRLVEGGAERQESVHRMLVSAKGELVLVHDVARPLLVMQVVQRVLDEAQRSGAAVPGIAIPDTLIQTDEYLYGAVLRRSEHRLVQTPQGFSTRLLRRAHVEARRKNQHATDDAQLIQALGYPVSLVEGDRRMFKITYPEDLILAEGLLETWES